MLKEWHVIIKLFTRQQKISFSALTMGTLVGSILETAGIVLVAPIIQLIQDPKAVIHNNYLLRVSHAFNLGSAHGLLTFFLLAVVLFYLLKSAFLGLLARYQNVFIYNLKYNLTNKLLSIYLHQPWSFYFSRNTAILMRNINLDMIVLTETIKAWVILFAEGFFVFIVCCVLFVYQPQAMAILILTCGPVFWLFNRLSNTILNKSKKERFYSEGEKLKYLKQGFDGMKDIIINGNEDFFLQKFKSPNYAETRATRQFMTLMQFPKLWLESLVMVALATLLSFSAGNHNLVKLLPFMGLLVISLFKILPSVNRIVTAVHAILYNEKSTASVYDDTLLEKNIPEQKNQCALSFNSEITVENLSFSYPDNIMPVLENINLIIPKGSITGIVGKTGSGKSTLVDLLAGILNPSRGAICVDGTDIHGNAAGWRQKISYIPQTVYLFDDSIKNNIALGVQPEEIDNIKLASVAALAELEEFIVTLPDGMNTKVGDAGIRLSGGQRQRIGIARALYKNSEILILDEATNALDIHTEKKILANINLQANRKTIITISHRMASLVNCDTIYKIGNGNLSEYIATGAGEIPD